MSVLLYSELVKLIEAGVLENVKPEAIQGASIDLHLGPIIHYEINPARQPKIVLKNKDQLYVGVWDLRDGPFTLSPGMCILASTAEIFNLPPDIVGDYKLNSSMGRVFLEHMKAGWCDPTWNGSALTLELKNCTQFHQIELNDGDRIGQIVLSRGIGNVPPERSYAIKGRYNGDKTVSGVKKSREESCTGV